MYVLFSSDLRRFRSYTHSIDGLAMVGNAPKVFSLTTKNGLPYVSLGTCAAFALLAYMGINSGSGTVFGWFSNSMSPFPLSDAQ